MSIESMVGKTIVQHNNPKVRGDAILFCMNDGTKYLFQHHQDCCESVDIEDICGDMNDLIGSPLLVANEVSNHNHVGYDSQTWTFYNFATIKGGVTVRWLGQSNGYYSESVDLTVIKPGEVVDTRWCYSAESIAALREVGA